MSKRDYGIEMITSAPFDQNTYVVWRLGGGEALVVDPGFDVEAIEGVLRREGLTVAAILNTHGHADHIAGNGDMKESYPDAPLMIGRNDAHLLTDANANLSAPFGLALESPEADRLLGDGEVIEVGGFRLVAREIAGHSPGSVVFIAEGEERPFVLAGDVLFAGSVGRTDFPGGSAATLFAGIREKLYVLPDETAVYSGHGPATTIGREKRTNPFVNAQTDR